MSRPYNEQWQRRKSMLIRSLFYDMPVLSPVPEESFESDLNHSRDPLEAQNRASSPLPPLIIEKEPNRHDEPEEYYIKLLNKIKRIYRKLFIENQSLDSDDINITNSIYEDDVNYYESDEEMNVRDVSNDNASLDSHISINSDGYVGDFESSNESIDNNSDMNVEESNNQIDEQQESEIEQMDAENYLESSDTENVDQESNKHCSNNESIDKEMTEASKSIETSLNDSNSKSQDVTANTDIICQEMDITEVNKTNEQIHEENSFNTFGIDQEMVDKTYAVIKEVDLFEEIRLSEEREVVAPDNEKSKADEGMDVSDDEDDTFDAGIDYRQITTVALVHVDGSQQNEGRISPVYETVASPILPTGVVIVEEIGGDTVLEEQGDPEQTSSLENNNNNEGIDEMRTPRTELSIQSNPISRYSSNISDQSPNIEPTRALEIENTHHSLEPNVSNDIHDILTTIINDSHKDSVFNGNGRKRKLFEDISVQTVRQVSWDDVKENFFVGPPKIFRLCRCVDHDCGNFI